MIYKTLFITIVSASLLIGCSFGESKKAAEAAADQLFIELAKGPSEKYYDLYSEEFYSSTSREDWKRMREKVNEKLGNYNGHKLVSWNVKSFNLKTTTVLVYTVTYAKYEATETLAFVGSDHPKLVGHNINSKGLLLE
jgi:hypothetical protein